VEGRRGPLQDVEEQQAADGSVKDAAARVEADVPRIDVGAGLEQKAEKVKARRVHRLDGLSRLAGLVAAWLGGEGCGWARRGGAGYRVQGRRASIAP